MSERNAAAPRDKRIELRIGINVGDIIIADDDIFRDGVKIAARLEGIAESGGVCISEDAYRPVAQLCLSDETGCNEFIEASKRAGFVRLPTNSPQP